MGQSLSNPSSTASTSPMPPSLPPEEANPAVVTKKNEENGNKEGEAEDEDLDEDCGFCLFMKEGGCRETFTEWQKCVKDGEKNNEDVVEKCFQATSALQKCMEENSDYYEPLMLVKQVADAWMSELEEAEKEKEKDRANKKKKADRTQMKEDSI